MSFCGLILILHMLLSNIHWIMNAIKLMADAALVLSIKCVQTPSDMCCLSPLPAASPSLFTPTFQSAGESAHTVLPSTFTLAHSVRVIKKHCTRISTKSEATLEALRYSPALKSVQKARGEFYLFIYFRNLSWTTWTDAEKTGCIFFFFTECLI